MVFNYLLSLLRLAILSFLIGLFISALLPVHLPSIGSRTDTFVTASVIGCVVFAIGVYRMRLKTAKTQDQKISFIIDLLFTIFGSIAIGSVVFWLTLFLTRGRTLQIEQCYNIAMLAGVVTFAIAFIWMVRSRKFY